jgi:regulation of enolase protein 1 (concanavalin A-like superfamily)
MQQGYVEQQPMPQQPQQPEQTQQTTKFYKSAIFGFSSASGRFQRDLPKMQKAGWRVTFYAFLVQNHETFSTRAKCGS